MSKANSQVHGALEDVFKDIQSLVVVGGNWGDEGKGKIIDLIMNYYDTVVRFSGGANAGHTVFTPEGVKVVSHLIPCGLAQRKTSVLARGEFFDLKLFIEELESSRVTLNGNLPDIYIDHMAPLWTPWHGLLESWLESIRGVSRINTTGKAMGPLSGLHKLRVGPVVSDLYEGRDHLLAILKFLHTALAPLFEKMDLKEPVYTPEEVTDMLLKRAPQIKDKICDTSFYLHEALGKGDKILFEGAQALGLDNRWGTYPYVSSGNSIASGASIGTGLPMQAFAATLMVAKVLPTRVGAGPFPSEIWDRDLSQNFPKTRPELFEKGPARDEFLKNTLSKINSKQANPAELAQYFQVLGDERGATTGRGRSIGYLDIPWIQYGVRVNGPKWLALTRFDMLSGLKSIPVVVGYKLDGKLLKPGEMPNPSQLLKVETVVEEWPCWEEDIYGITDFGNLPATAQEFLKKLAAAIGVPILLAGTGAERDAVVMP
jgi:adenylosuccinate synthase